MNILRDPLLPVRCADGTEALARVCEVHQLEDGRQPVSLLFADNLLNAGALELVIGLLQVFAAPADEAGWVAIWRNGLDPQTLRAIFEPHTADFEVFGDKPAFQDITVRKSKQWPIEKLFHGSPGDLTRVQNKDFNGGSVSRIGLGTAIIALFTFQAHAPMGGPGFRTSIAGGGPLRAIPDIGETLFHRAWACVLTDPDFQRLGAGPKAAEPRLPWLKPGGRKITRADAPASHLYFAAPRRLALDPPVEEGICPLSGIHGPMVETLREAQAGPEYTEGSWEHPLTPYRRTKDAGKTGAIELAPVLAAQFSMGITWKDRVGLILDRTDKEGGGISTSRIMATWRATRALSVIPDGRLAVSAYGVQAKQAKICGLVLSTQPVRILGNSLERDYEELITEAVRCASLASWHLEVAVRDGWFSQREQAALKKARKIDVMDARVDPATLRFWSDTEQAADDYTETIADALTAADEDKITAAKEQLLLEVGRAALTIFDDTFRDAWMSDPDRVVEARRRVRRLHRFKNIRQAIGLPALTEEVV